MNSLSGLTAWWLCSWLEQKQRGVRATSPRQLLRGRGSGRGMAAPQGSNTPPVNFQQRSTAHRLWVVWAQGMASMKTKINQSLRQHFCRWLPWSDVLSERCWLPSERRPGVRPGVAQPSSSGCPFHCTALRYACGARDSAAPELALISAVQEALLEISSFFLFFLF